ncbi:neuronal acetylcholine receptor subunit alpha-10-like [Glandiceps talaboti]
MSMRSVLIAILLFVCLMHTGLCSKQSNPYSALIHDLLDGYDNLALPVNNTDEIVEIELSVCLHQVEEINEKHQQIILTAYIQQAWYDPYLTWNSSDFNGITEVRVPANKIWLPDTAIFNTVDDTYGRLMTETNAIISHDGHVVWVAPALMQNSCKFDGTYWPFDKQRCEILFASWTYEKTQVKITNSSIVHLENYQEQEDWTLIEAFMSPCVTLLTHYRYEMSGSVLSMVLQRHPRFCILFKMVPFALVSGISVLVFLLPVESGEKMSLGITNLLTLILFYVEISHNFPSTEAKFPIIGTFYFAIICLVSASCILTVMVLNIYHRKNCQRPVPWYIKRLFFGRFGLHNFVWYVPGREKKVPSHLTFRRKHKGQLWRSRSDVVKQNILIGNSLLSSSNSNSPLLSRKQYEESDKVFQTLTDMRCDISQTLRRVQRMESRLHIDDQEDLVDNRDDFFVCTDWQKIAVIMDQLFFIILSTVAFCTSLVFVISLTNGSDITDDIGILDEC